MDSLQNFQFNVCSIEIDNHCSGAPKLFSNTLWMLQTKRMEHCIWYYIAFMYVDVDRSYHTRHGIHEHGKMFHMSRIHKYLAYKPDFPDLKAP